jgi:hypothetical protein
MPAADNIFNIKHEMKQALSPDADNFLYLKIRKTGDYK